MHCGRMRCQFALREYDGIEEKKKRQKEEERLKRLAERKRIEEEEKKKNASKGKDLANPFQVIKSRHRGLEDSLLRSAETSNQIFRNADP